MRTGQAGRASVHPASFSRLWWSFVATSIGSGAAAGALPLIAVTVLGASASAVTAMSAVGIVSGSLVAPWASRVLRVYPVGRVLATTEFVQAVGLVAVLAAGYADQLSLPLVTVVLAVQTCGFLIYTAAVGLTVKQLTADDDLVHRSGRLEAVTWTTQGLGAC